MLFEPESSLVMAWLAAGNAPRRIPFGISGKVWCFAQHARQMGAWGAFKRYGGRHVPREVYALIASGQLTVAQARVETAWPTLHAHGPMCASELSRAMEIYPAGAQRVMHVLLSIARAERVRDSRFERVRAVGEQPPHWTDCMTTERAAA